MYFNIIVDSPGEQDIRGRVSNIDELFAVLTKKEQQEIFKKDAFNDLENFFNTKEAKYSEDSYLGCLGNLSVNFISNGHEITTLLFYF